MELWIRHQNKTILQKVDNLLISNGNNAEGTFAIYTNSLPAKNILGRYKTKERALEVLDEIEKILKPQLTIKDNGKIIGPDDIRELYTSFEGAIIKEGATCELKEFSNFVYQMPAE